MRKVSDGPRAPDYALAVFAPVAAIATYLSLWNGEGFWPDHRTSLGPYWEYHQNTVIRLIAFGSLSIDIAIPLCVIGWRLRQSAQQFSSRALVFLALAGAALTWLELWYGSTFYYGEVRDKQGLPIGVNNGGLLGSIVFLTFVIWHVRPTGRRGVLGLSFRILASIALIAGHILVVRLVAEPWRLFL